MNSKKMMLIGASTLFFVLVSIVWWGLSPTWLPIYPNQLSDSSQNEAIDILNQRGMEYKIDKKTNQLLLRSRDITKAQAALSENGLPKEPSNGLEIFNNSDYGLSEFAQNINYQRGMEEELARTLRRMTGIKNARVHLTIKKESLFEERRQEPKASVVLSLKPDFALDQEKVLGIQEVVAAAVPNLDARKVVIITDNGRVLTSEGEGGQPNKLSSVEEKYGRLVDDLLRNIFAVGDYKVSVNVLFDNKKKMTIEENIYPDLNSGKGFLLRKKSSEKTPDIAIDGNRSGSQSQSEEEYVYSKEKSEIVYPGGEILKISVGLVVSSPIDDIERDAISLLIFESLGMNAERGDKVSVFVRSKSLYEKVVNNRIEADVISLADDQSLQKSTTNHAVENKIVNYLRSKIWMLLAVTAILFLMSNIFLILWLRGKSKPKNYITDAERSDLVAEIKHWMN